MNEKIYCPYCGPWNGHPDGVEMEPVVWEYSYIHFRTQWRAHFRCPNCKTYSPGSAPMNSAREAEQEARSIALRRFKPLQKPLTLEDVAQHNIEKLKKRYPEGFSAERSLHREA